MSLKEKYERAAAAICRQGMIPFPVNDTSISILKNVIDDNEEELDLISAFAHNASQTLDELEKSSNLPQKKIQEIAEVLAKKGLLFNQPSSSGVMVYRLLPLMTVGLLEYKFMGELKGDPKEKELAQLFTKLIEELRNQVQSNYDALMPMLQKSPPVDRTVPSSTAADGKPIKIIPLDRKIELPEEFILPSQSVEEIINNFDDIAVGHCFCRQRHETLGEPCATHAPTLNCFTFGKSARHTVTQGFARPVSKEEALKIMKESEDAGLVHKAFHPGSNINRPETSICNCCKDCCDTLRLWRDGVVPLINSTYYLSVIDQEVCSGCGLCIDQCPTQAISLDAKGKAERDERFCFGCGVCARFCPEKAISLKEGLRRVFIPPPRQHQPL